MKKQEIIRGFVLLFCCLFSSIFGVVEGSSSCGTLHRCLTSSLAGLVRAAVYGFFVFHPDGGALARIGIVCGGERFFSGLISLSIFLFF